MSDLLGGLVAARRADRQIRLDASAETPADEATAYAIQAEIAAALGAAAAGWKVGQSPDGLAFAAPILSCDVFAHDTIFSLPEGDPINIEAELALRLGRDLPPRAEPYAREDILAATASIFVGIELVRARLRNEPEPGFFARLADNFNNRSYVIGGGRPDARSVPLERLRVRLFVDGDLLENCIGSHPSGDPLAPVVAWASRQGDRLGGLRAGQFVTTGTLTKPLPIEAPMRVQALMEAVGEAAASFAGQAQP
jgi:2-keto-4-pentenoate hydratase